MLPHTVTEAVDDSEFPDIVSEIDVFIQNRVPHGTSCSIERDDEGAVVVITPVNASLTHKIGEFVQNRVPQGVKCSVICDDCSVAVTLELVDNPIPHLISHKIRSFRKRP